MAVIQDGAGSGRLSKVDIRNRLEVNSISQSVEHFANFSDGKAAHALFTVTPDSDGNTIFYAENTGNAAMVFEGFYITTTAACELSLRRNTTGTPVGGTDIDPVPVNTSSAYTFATTMLSGNAITGTVNGEEFFKYKTPTLNETKFVNFEADFVLTPSKNFSMLITTAGATIDLNFLLYEIEF